PGALRLRPVQLEVGVLAPVEEQELAVAGALDPLQELLRHDLIGVDVCPVEDGDAALDTANRLHATTAGLTRCVRPPLPWRPSKFRFDVDAQRSPGARMSGFIPRHIEQPARRHSKPARSKTRSSPSSSAWRFTAAEPGTTSARTPSLTRLPSTTAAATRRSSIRAFVHEPMKTRSTRMSAIGVPGSRPM